MTWARTKTLYGRSRKSADRFCFFVSCCSIWWFDRLANKCSTAIMIDARDTERILHRLGHSHALATPRFRYLNWKPNKFNKESLSLSRFLSPFVFASDDLGCPKWRPQQVFSPFCAVCSFPRWVTVASFVQMRPLLLLPRTQEYLSVASTRLTQLQIVSECNDVRANSQAPTANKHSHKNFLSRKRS